MPKEQETWRQQVKSIAGRQWHPDLKLWSIPYCKDTVRHFHGMFREVTRYNFQINANIPDRYIPQPKEKPKYDSKKGKIPTIVPKYDAERIRLKEQLTIMRYSHTTIKSYQIHFKAFIYHYNNTPPSAITEQQIMQYMLYIVQKRKLAQGTQGQIINAIKFYYEKVLKQPKKTYYLKHPKKQKRLPSVFSEQEVSRLLAATENIKHRCILMLMYSAGLRIGEVVKLQIYDIKSDEGCILIRQAKGKKDRYTLLAPKLLHWLRAYFKVHRPKYWLFEGEYGGQYSQSSIQKIFTAAKKKSKVNPHATTHTLRHSFATHLVHKGVNLRYIQELLGHNSSKTTEIYTHIAQSDYKKIQSPLENLNLDF